MTTTIPGTPCISLTVFNETPPLIRKAVDLQSMKQLSTAPAVSMNVLHNLFNCDKN